MSRESKIGVTLEIFGHEEIHGGNAKWDEKQKLRVGKTSQGDESGTMSNAWGWAYSQ